MNITLLIIIAGIIAAAAELLGGALIASRRDLSRSLQEYFIGLGAGFILALAVIELIPESLENIGEIAPLWILIGFSTIHFVEHTVVEHLHFGEETHKDIMISKTASFSAFAGLFIHAFFDGFAISAGMYYDFTLGVMIFLAILLHKFPEGLTISSIMIAAQQPKKIAMMATFGVAGGTMLGIMMIFFLKNMDPSITGYAFAFSAGAAMYVGASDLIPEINRSHNRFLSLIVFAGMLLFYLSRTLLHSYLAH